MFLYLLIYIICQSKLIRAICNNYSNPNIDCFFCDKFHYDIEYKKTLKFPSKMSVIDVKSQCLIKSNNILIRRIFITNKDNSNIPNDFFDEIYENLPYSLEKESKLCTE